jgi:hypothetical protein
LVKLAIVGGRHYDGHPHSIRINVEGCVNPVLLVGGYLVLSYPLDGDSQPQLHQKIPQGKFGLTNRFYYRDNLVFIYNLNNPITPAQAPPCGSLPASGQTKTTKQADLQQLQHY